MKLKMGVSKFFISDAGVVYKIFCNGDENILKILFENYLTLLKLVEGKEGFEQLIEASSSYTYTFGGQIKFQGESPGRFSVLKVLDGGEPVSVNTIDSVVLAGPQVSKILKVLRASNIVLRDITPGNVLVKDGKLTMTDFEYGFFPGCKYKDLEDAPEGLSGPFKSPHGFDDAFAFREIWRGEGRELVLEDDIREQIRVIATKGYRDGSSVWVGTPYHIMPFEDFSDVRAHFSACIKEYDVIKQFILENKISVKTALDIGSNVGYFAFNINRDFGAKVLGIEKDDLVQKVAVLLKKFYEIKDVDFVEGDAYDCPLEMNDVVIFMNTHMWMHKQHGFEKTLDFMKRLAKSTKHLFFMTAHAESIGIYKVFDLPNKESIISYLSLAGFKNVKPLFDSYTHENALRVLLHAEGGN